VLQTYQEQFQSGTGAYRLLDLSTRTVGVHGKSASVRSRYTIGSGGAGSVSFDLRKTGRGWLISRIVASC
jgi:hypothetical protein